jgi:hypothetical protein
MLKALVDPNAAPVRALPREVRELMIAANNGYLRMTIFDSSTVFSGNSAHFTEVRHDALCRPLSY